MAYTRKVIVCPECGGTTVRCVGSRRDCSCGHQWSTSQLWKDRQAAECLDAIKDKAIRNGIPIGSSAFVEYIKSHVHYGENRGGAKGYVKTIIPPTKGYGARFLRWRLGKMKVTMGDLARGDLDGWGMSKSKLLKLRKHELQRIKLTNLELMPYMHMIYRIARANEIGRCCGEGLGTDTEVRSEVREDFGQEA